ncbi:hypothetical protein [Actinomadura kijaniata]|uniref:hypothetical protein n=1 Tax=Actinomadura kijaniata TaxID=46161 RepID=UPI0031CEC15A
MGALGTARGRGGAPPPPAAPRGAVRRPSRSWVSSSENATSSAASHATCVLAIRVNVRSCATGALLLRSLLSGADEVGAEATVGLGAIGGSATWGLLVVSFGLNEAFGDGGV